MFAYLCIICVKTIINFLEYSTILLSVLVGYLGYLLWTFEQIGLSNTLLEQNPSKRRGLLVFKNLAQGTVVWRFDWSLRDSPPGWLVHVVLTEDSIPWCLGLSIGLHECVHSMVPGLPQSAPRKTKAEAITPFKIKLWKS